MARPTITRGATLRMLLRILAQFADGYFAGWGPTSQLHVQACFSAERAHHEAIAAASDAELYGYDINARWPSNGV